MKKIYILGVLVLLLSFGSIVHADQCTPPTPPTCYNTVPTYSNTGLQSDGSIFLGSGQVLLPNGNIIQNPTKQVQVNCSGTQQEIDYEVQKLSYNTCLQTNSSNSNTSTDLNSSNSNTNAPSPTCPNSFTQDQLNNTKQLASDAYTKLNNLTSDYSTQSQQLSTGNFTLSDSEQAQVNDAVSRSDALIQQQNTANTSYEQTLQTACNLYGTKCSNSAQIQDQQKITNLQIQRDATIAQLKQSFASTRLSALKSLYGINYQSAKAMWDRYSALSNCPVTSSTPSNTNKSTNVANPSVASSVCPTNSSLGSDQFCHCNTGYEHVTGFGSDNNTCILENEAMQQIGVNLYGVHVNYNATTKNYECETGYVFQNGSDTNNNKCIISTKPSTTTLITKKVSLHAKQIKSFVSTTTPIIVNSSTTTVPITTPIKIVTNIAISQKHWYQWLNPFSWFK